MIARYRNFNIQLPHRKETFDCVFAHIDERASQRLGVGGKDAIVKMTQKLTRSASFESFMDYMHRLPSGQTVMLTVNLNLKGVLVTAAFPFFVNEGGSCTLTTVLDVTGRKYIYVLPGQHVIRFDDETGCIFYGTANGAAERIQDKGKSQNA